MIEDLASHPEPHVTIAELADYWQVSRRQIYRYIEDGTLEAVRLGPKLYRIQTSVAQEYQLAKSRLPGIPRLDDSAGFQKAVRRTLKRVDIGRKLSALRREQGISQRDLARLLSTSQSLIAKMEKGHANFEILTVIRTAVVLGGKVELRITRDKKRVSFVGWASPKAKPMKLTLKRRQKSTSRKIARV
jgi:excisionase family DNA binding protein